MNNNDVFRRIRYAFDLSDERVSQIFLLTGTEIEPPQIRALLGREREEGAIECTDALLANFLDGLVIDRRGPPPEGAPKAAGDAELTNNAILKKLRIALSYREDDMMKALAAGGAELSRTELRALFRNPAHRHYVPCGNQVLRNFLKGITTILRH